MGFLAKLKALFKKEGNKFNKITVEDVNNSIYNLNRQIDAINKELEEFEPKIEELTEKGRKEKSQEMKLLRAKQINSMKAERKQKTDQMMYLTYNISLLKELKIAVSNNEFINNNSKDSLNALLGDAKGLATFLNESLGKRVNAEQMMVEATNIFKESESYYEKPQEIYGISESDSALLAQFEETDQLDDEQAVFADNKAEKKVENVEDKK